MVHSIAVPAILTDMRLDRTCVIAGLLNGIVQHTPFVLADLKTLIKIHICRIGSKNMLSKLEKAFSSCQNNHIEDDFSSPSKRSRKNHELPEELALTSLQTDTSMSSVTPSCSAENGFASWQHESRRRKGEVRNKADDLRFTTIAMTEDVRLIVEKPADLHYSILLLGHISLVMLEKISKELFELFALLAAWLGMRRFNSKLKGLSFMYLHSKRYQRLIYDVETMLTRSKFGHHFKAAKATNDQGCFAIRS